MQTNMEMKLIMLNQTERLQIHPRRCSDLMLPPTMPMSMMMIMQTMKHRLGPARSEMIRPLLKMSTMTVQNCWRDWATLMKCRVLGPKMRKKMSP